jgi:hypothetical protein
MLDLQKIVHEARQEAVGKISSTPWHTLLTEGSFVPAQSGGVTSQPLELADVLKAGGKKHTILCLYFSAGWSVCTLGLP